MPQFRFQIFALTALLLLGACATMPNDFEQPGISLVSVTPRASDDGAPQFDIVLHVTNPNRETLAIKGMSYTIRLDGSQLIDGAAREFPEIAGFGEADVTVSARANLFGGLSLLSGWLTQPSNKVEFVFDARVDIGAFYPMIKIQKTGTIAFQ